MRTFEAEELALLPGHVPQPSSIRRDVEDHRDEDDGGPRLGVVCPVHEVPTRMSRQIYTPVNHRHFRFKIKVIMYFIIIKVFC